MAASLPTTSVINHNARQSCKASRYPFHARLKTNRPQHYEIMIAYSFYLSDSLSKQCANVCYLLTAITTATVTAAKTTMVRPCQAYRLKIWKRETHKHQNQSWTCLRNSVHESRARCSWQPDRSFCPLIPISVPTVRYVFCTCMDMLPNFREKASLMLLSCGFLHFPMMILFLSTFLLSYVHRAASLTYLWPRRRSSRFVQHFTASARIYPRQVTILFMMPILSHDRFFNAICCHDYGTTVHHFASFTICVLSDAVITSWLWPCVSSINMCVLSGVEAALKTFETFLQSQTHEFDYVIDGANVAYHKQNHIYGRFSYGQVRKADVWNYLIFDCLYT